MFDGSCVILPPRVFFDSRIKCLPLLMPIVSITELPKKHGCVCFHESNGLSTNCYMSNIQISLVLYCSFESMYI